MGNRAPPTGGSEVLQADEYIKGLLLWTVQSLSCCFNAACPVCLLSVPSVEHVVDIKAVDGPEATLKGNTTETHTHTRGMKTGLATCQRYVFKYM